MLENAEEIIAFIKNAKKKTPMKVYINGRDLNGEYPNIKIFGTEESRVLIGEKDDIATYLDQYKNQITDIHQEIDARNSAVGLLDISDINARIEPGAIIRESVQIGDNVVIMMGSIINIGAKIGDNTMIDMGVVLGGRVEVGENCHIGAGSVLAGVIEPPSATPVIIEDNVVIGANVVVLEGVRVKNGAVVGAGSIVTKDVESGVVVVGNPAHVVKHKDEKTRDKTKVIKDLRKL